MKTSKLFYFCCVCNILRMNSRGPR